VVVVVMVMMMGGGIVVFNHKGWLGDYVEWVGYEVEEVQISNWLS
jgi:hypothetical protein